MTAPNTSQCDRDALDNYDVGQSADLAGYGPHAAHIEEPMPS